LGEKGVTTYREETYLYGRYRSSEEEPRTKEKGGKIKKGIGG